MLLFLQALEPLMGRTASEKEPRARAKLLRKAVVRARRPRHARIHKTLRTDTMPKETMRRNGEKRHTAPSRPPRKPPSPTTRALPTKAARRGSMPHEAPARKTPCEEDSDFAKVGAVNG